MRTHPFGFCCVAFLLVMQCSSHASIAQEPEAPKPTKTVVYYLKRVEAAGMQQTLTSLYADTEHATKVKIVAENATNALLVSAPDDQIQEIERVIKELDAAPETPKVVVRPIDEIKVFSLKNAIANQSAEAISQLGFHEVRIAADSRTNTVIATGQKQELDTVEAILMRLDEAQTQNSMTVRVYPIKNVSPDKITDNMNQLGLNSLFSMDAENRQLLVRGDEEVHKATANLIQTLDVAEQNPLPGPLQLRIVWLVEEKLAGKDAREPAKNLERVIQTLNDKLGVTNLKMAAQLLVTIDPTKDDPNQTFTAHGTTALQEGIPTRLEAVGQIVGQVGGTPTIQLSIEASQPGRERAGFNGQSNTNTSQTLTSLTTKVMAPPGHSIVLGMTPIQSADSVFVLQLLSNEETPPPGK